MALWSHRVAQKANPGFVESNHFKNLSHSYDSCKKCGVIKVEGVHHCSKCGRCVYKMDHHCPWINNCVGYLNIKSFILFLFYAASLTSYGVGMMIHQSYKHDMQHVSLFTVLPT